MCRFTPPMLHRHPLSLLQIHHLQVISHLHLSTLELLFRHHALQSQVFPFPLFITLGAGVRPNTYHILRGHQTQSTVKNSVRRLDFAPLWLTRMKQISTLNQLTCHHHLTPEKMVSQELGEEKMMQWQPLCDKHYFIHWCLSHIFQ